MRKKFADAFNGLKIACGHRAVRIQLFLGILAIAGGLIIRLDFHEWLAFILCIGMVVTAEIFNTAIEKTGDYLMPGYDDRIRTIKDLSSAAVLISAAASLFICVLCVLRRILQ